MEDQRLADYKASYDIEGQLVSEIGPSGQTRYSYDTLGRMETTTDPANSVTRYTFDGDTNRTAVYRDEVATHSYAYAADATARLLSVDGGPAVSYNAPGDTIAMDGETYSYDAFGALVGITTPTGQVTLVRDVLGRVRRRTTTDTTGAVTADVVYRFSGASDAPSYETNPTGAITTSYLSSEVIYAGARTAVPTFSYFDLHGDLVATADATGVRTAGPYSYDPYGVPEGPTSSPFGYVGKWSKITDDTSGLILMGARPYDPTLGRFLTVDPIAGGSANDYDYVSGDPINDFDLDGTMCFVKCGWKKAAKKIGKRALKSRFVRMTVAGLGAAAICAGTGGLGCVVLAGAGIGAGLGVANRAANGGSLLRAPLSEPSRVA